MIFSGWFLVNILAPMLLPVLGTLPLLLFVHRLPVPSGGELLISAVKDGQPCWAAIAMCVSTIDKLWLAPGAVRFGGTALAEALIVFSTALFR